VSLESFITKVCVKFRKCKIGEIIRKSNNDQYIYCDICPLGKYSIVSPENYSDKDSNLLCKNCPNSALYCYSSIINLKNGYWRIDNITDLIELCLN
jgi:hypothetical protein